MSQENVELVRRLLPPPDANLVSDVFFRGDHAGWKAYEQVLSPWFADDFAGIAQIGGLTRSFRGLKGWRDGWLDWLEPWESYRTVIVRVIDAGDRVLVRGRDFGRRRGTEAEVEMPGASNVWTFRDGRVARLDHFTDEAKALEAAGLSE